jgi:hypothetical protein
LRCQNNHLALIENNIVIDGSAQQVDLRASGDAATGNRFVGDIIHYTSPHAALMNVNSKTPRALAEWDYNLYFPAGEQLLAIPAPVAGDGL